MKLKETKEMGDGRWGLGEKKLSSTLALGLSSSLKLFLVILVLFGLIGSIFAVSNDDGQGNSIVAAFKVPSKVGQGLTVQLEEYYIAKNPKGELIVKQGWGTNLPAQIPPNTDTSSIKGILNGFASVGSNPSTQVKEIEIYTGENKIIKYDSWSPSTSTLTGGTTTPEINRLVSGETTTTSQSNTQTEYIIKGGLSKDNSGNPINIPDQIVDGAEKYAKVTLGNGEEITLIKVSSKDKDNNLFTSIHQLNADGTITSSVYDEYTNSNGIGYLANIKTNNPNLIIQSINNDNSLSSPLTLAELKNKPNVVIATITIASNTLDKTKFFRNIDGFEESRTQCLGAGGENCDQIKSTVTTTTVPGVIFQDMRTSAKPINNNLGEYMLSCSDKNLCNLKLKNDAGSGISGFIDKNSVIKEILSNPNIKGITWDDSVKFEEDIRIAFSIYRGENTDPEKLAAHLRSGYKINSDSGIYAEIKSGDWTEKNTKLIQTYLKNNQPLSPEATTKIQEWYTTTYSEYNTLQERKNKGEKLSEDDVKKLSQLKTDLDAKGNIISNSLTSEQLYTLYSNMDSTQFSVIANVGNDCKAGIMNFGCLFHTTIKEDQILTKSYLDAISKAPDKSNLDKITLDMIKGSFSTVPSKCDSNNGGTIKDCKDYLNDMTQNDCKGDNPTQCEKLKASNLKILNLGIQNTQVQTTPLYDILTLLTNPDQNSIKAAKLFGFEANYSNVPAFLKESVPSQICLAKIDGYLDKQVANTVNGQGGITSYGCSQDYTQTYNEQTKKYEKVPNTQCLDVLADLRAQRTQITPDNKTLISYSYFLRSPPNTKVKYVIAISYKEGNTIKKKQIIALTELNGTKNGFDNVEIALNGSVSSIDENSFTINLLAVYENKKVYQKISYPIPPISYGDSYSAPIPAKASTSNEANSNGGSQNAELSTDDMLAMI